MIVFPNLLAELPTDDTALVIDAADVPPERITLPVDFLLRMRAGVT